MAGVTHAAFNWLNTQKGDFPMMFRKWMIGACFAVTAMAISGKAEAQVPSATRVWWSELGVVTQNKSTRVVSMTAEVSDPYCPGCYDPGPTRGRHMVTETVVPPMSKSQVCYMVTPSEAEEEAKDLILRVKVKNRPAVKVRIRAEEVARVMSKSGFPADAEVHPAIQLVVDAKGFVKASKPYVMPDTECP